MHASKEELGVCPGLGPQKVGIMKPVHQTCLASLVGLTDMAISKFKLQAKIRYIRCCHCNCCSGVVQEHNDIPLNNI